MRGMGVVITGLFVVGLVLFPVKADSRSGGAQGSSTGALLPGGFREATCGSASNCHNDAAVNSGLGTLVIDAPAAYAPGAALEFTVRVEEAGRSTFGFQVAVKDSTHHHVGELQLVDPAATRYAVTVNTFYVTHTKEGTAQNEWTVRWVAPAEDAGPVTLYAAGNAANGDDKKTGDHIYTTDVTLSSGTATAVDEEPFHPAFTLERAYPNPFSTRTTIRYALQRPAAVTLAVYDALGRRVRVLDLGRQAVGTHRVHLDAGGLPAGLYLYELRTPEVRETRPLMLIK
ncbi:MAG: choice-of-anchor V domain-containing protein [Rhodothermales bacterium]